MDGQRENETLTWAVGGMDCASCATKIRGALERLPGVSEVTVSVMAERLTLSLDTAATPAVAVERTVEGLGYTVARGEAKAPATRGFVLPEQPPGPAPAMGDHDERRDHGPSESPWYGSAKGRLVILTGSLLAAAWALKLVVPGPYVPWLFVVACLIGVAPVARRAFAALRAGMPFTIESLMTIAATGALFIGAAEEAALVVFLFAVGEVLEGVAAGRARASIRALADLVPTTALRVGRDGSTERSTQRSSRSATPCSCGPATASPQTERSSRASRESTRAR